jgi:hypothetical protein
LGHAPLCVPAKVAHPPQQTGLRQFHLRGLAKVEMLWACLTYNLQQWIRLRKPQAATA